MRREAWALRDTPKNVPHTRASPCEREVWTQCRVHKANNYYHILKEEEGRERQETVMKSYSDELKLSESVVMNVWNHEVSRFNKSDKNNINTQSINGCDGEAHTAAPSRPSQRAIMDYYGISCPPTLGWNQHWTCLHLF